MCIVPRLTPFLVAAALGCIPHDVRAKCTDTADVLAERLGRSGFLDDAHVLDDRLLVAERGPAVVQRLVEELGHGAPARRDEEQLPGHGVEELELLGARGLREERQVVAARSA